MAYDQFASFVPSPLSFGARGRIITPGPTDLDEVVKAVVCLDSGNITVVPAENDDNDTITFTGVYAGFLPPFRIRRVTSATMPVATVEG